MNYKILGIASTLLFGGFTLRLEGAAHITPSDSQQKEIAQIASGTDNTQYRATLAMIAHGKLTSGPKPINTSEEARKGLFETIFGSHNLIGSIIDYLPHENSLLALGIKKDISRKYNNHGQFTKFGQNHSGPSKSLSQNFCNHATLENAVYFLRRNGENLYLDQITQQKERSFKIATLSEEWLQNICPIGEVNWQEKTVRAYVTTWSLYKEGKNNYKLFVGFEFSISTTLILDAYYSFQYCYPIFAVQFTLDTTKSEDTAVIASKTILARQKEYLGPYLVDFRGNRVGTLPTPLPHNMISSITRGAGALKIELSGKYAPKELREVVLYDIDQIDQHKAKTAAVDSEAVSHMIYNEKLSPHIEQEKYHKIILTIEKIIMLELGPTGNNDEDCWCQVTVYDNKTYLILHNQKEASPGKTICPRTIIKHHKYNYTNNLYVTSDGLFLRREEMSDKLECVVLWNSKGNKAPRIPSQYQTIKKEEFLNNVLQSQAGEDYGELEIIATDNGKFFVGIKQSDNSVILHRWAVSPNLVCDLAPKNPLLGAHKNEIPTIQKILDLFHVHKAPSWNKKLMCTLLMWKLSASKRKELEQYFAQYNELIQVKAILSRFHSETGPSHTELMNKVSESTQKRLNEYFAKFEAIYGKKPEDPPQKKSYIRKLASQDPFVLFGKLACTAAVGTIAIRYMRKKIHLPTLINHKTKQPVVAL